MTLEILNAAGATVRRFSSADPVPPLDPNTLAVNAVWQRTQEPPSAAAGMHRFVWDLRPTPPAGGRGRGGRGGGGGGGGRGGLPPVAPGRLLGEADGQRQDADAAADGASRIRGSAK